MGFVAWASALPTSQTDDNTDAKSPEQCPIGTVRFAIVGMISKPCDIHGLWSVGDQAATPLWTGKFARAHVANLVGCLAAILFASAIWSCRSEPM